MSSTSSFHSHLHFPEGGWVGGNGLLPCSFKYSATYYKSPYKFTKIGRVPKTVDDNMDLHLSLAPAAQFGHLVQLIGGSTNTYIETINGQSCIVCPHKIISFGNCVKTKDMPPEVDLVPAIANKASKCACQTA